jgi:hypothetical protein
MELIDNTKKIWHYPNAVKRKYHNKQVILVDLKDGSFQIEIVNYDKENCKEPCVMHSVIRDKVRVSSIRLSKETLIAILLNVFELGLVQAEEVI